MWPQPPARILAELSPMVAQASGKVAVACHHLVTGERWALNDAVLPAASLIKVPLAVAAYQAAERGELALLERVAVPGLAEDDEAEFDNLGRAPEGTRFTWRKVIDRMLTESDNAATNVLIERMGLGAIEGLGRQLALEGTALRRVMLDGAARQAGRENTTTAGDMVALLAALQRGELLNPAHTAELLGLLGQQRDLDKLAAGLPAEAAFAGKTGELPGWRHDMAIVDGQWPWRCSPRATRPQTGCWAASRACSTRISRAARRPATRPRPGWWRAASAPRATRGWSGTRSTPAGRTARSW